MDRVCSDKNICKQLNFVMTPPSWHSRLSTPVPTAVYVALSKQGHRFFTSLATADGTSAARLIRKFVGGSSKSVALDAISHLVSPNNTSFARLSPLAFPMYSVIREAPWFDWNPKLIADVIASLYKQQRFDEAETLTSEAVSKLGRRERDLCSFYCNLMDAHSKHKSKQGVLDSYKQATCLPSYQSSVYLKKQAYESGIGGLSATDSPNDAEAVMGIMKNEGLKPSVFGYRSLAFAYGRSGSFDDMKRVIRSMEGEGYGLDVVTANMVLSSLGAHHELSEMVSWLQRMRASGIPFSVRTYNSVLNRCPTVTSMVRGPKGVKPASVQALLDGLARDEALLVREVIEPSVLAGSVDSSPAELKLDLHGMHLGSAYLILLQWFDEARVVYATGDRTVPDTVTVVCGVGRHSAVRGESPVKGLVKEMMVQTRCPLRIDRKNVGCFVGKGRGFVDWLFQNSSA